MGCQWGCDWRALDQTICVCIVRPPCPKAGSRPPYDGSHTLESTNRRLQEDQPARSVIVARRRNREPKDAGEARLGLTPRRPHPYPCTNVALAPFQLPRAHFGATGLPKNSASQQPDQPKPPSLPPHPPLRAPPPYRPASRIPLRPLAFLSSQPVRRPGSSPWRQRAPHASTVRRRPPIPLRMSTAIPATVLAASNPAVHDAPRG